ncbi:MAG: host attachment protein [Phenylobacterium sp.]|uniref:host attachment protein n=1 Tax=Phenylobacterium sp. TaxID=1871053 RepID=UPI001217F0EF|nr:host attachment protein [Phenylobacterium sp.]TAJ71997.1 MAG: host attachment protein [Phenylobacterium sp.]
MDEGGVTWIVAADAVEARVFSERVRGGPLRALPECSVSANAAERRHHGLDNRAEHESHLRFFRRIATRLALAASRGEFERLALMGPPRALGLLRLALPSEVARRVDVTDPHDRALDDAETLRRCLSQARARTWSPNAAGG